MAYIVTQHRGILTGAQIICKLEQVLYLLVIVPIVAFLPAPLAYGIACRCGDWVYRHDTVARERLIRSIENVIGEQLSYTERAQMIRDFFRRRSCEAIDMVRLAGRGRALARLVEIRGLDHIEAALNAGKGAVLCSAHFGFYNGGFSLLGALGFPITVVGDQKSRSDPGLSLAKRLFFRFGVERRVARHRRRPNIQPAEGQVEAAIQITEILRANEVIGIAIDVPTPPEDTKRAIPVEFLGHQILVLPGSVTLAEMAGARVLTLVMSRSADWRHQVIEISPVSLEEGAVEAFKHCMTIIEAPIRQNPALWSGWDNPRELVELGLLSAY